jgi:hypothetical protein
MFIKTNKLKHELTKKPYAVLKATDVYDAVSTVLQNNDVPSHYYSIGEPMDDGVCLEYKDDDSKWIVYEGDRGQKSHVRSFDSAFKAGYDLFESLVIGDDKLSSMRTQFRARLNSIISNNMRFKLSKDASLFPRAMKPHVAYKVSKRAVGKTIKRFSGKVCKFPARKASRILPKESY